MTSIAAEESAAEEATILNALYGKAVKESERQRKLQAELEKARKLEARARIKLPEVDYSPEEQYKQELIEYARQVLKKLLIKALTLSSLRYVEDIATENLLYDAARRLVQLLLMRFKKFVKKGKGRQVIQFAKTEQEILQVYEKCIDEDNTQLSTSAQLCRTLQDYTDFYANRVFDENVKQTLLQAVARQLLLQDASAYASKTIIEAWASVRKTLALILKYLGADGQARITTLFKLVNVKDVE